MSDQLFEGWAVVEVMGHRKVAGFCDTVRVAGVEMLRVSPPGATEADPDGEPDILSAAAIFALHPCDEETARRIANPVTFAPPQLVSRYEPEPDDPDDWDSPDSEESTGVKPEVVLTIEQDDGFGTWEATAGYPCDEFVEHELTQRGYSREVAVGRALIGLGREILSGEGETEETDDAGRESADDEPEEPTTDSGDPETETASEGQAEADNEEADEEEIPW